MMGVKERNKAPHSPGVYLFKKGEAMLYIGKAADLKKRLSSYFRKNIGGKMRQMLAGATKLEWLETSSEVEAFLKEAELIKKYQPKYNYLLRDDKNYFYVGVTKETFPKLFITHQPRAQSARIKNQKSRINPKLNSNYLGPFTSGAALKSVLRLLRRVFPYCTCKTSHQRPCLNAQIGRCLGFCCDKSKSQIQNPKFQNEYKDSLKNIIAVLSGKRKRILAELKRAMNTAAKNEDFEKAAKIRDQIWGLENIFSHQKFLEGGLPARIPPSPNWQKTEKYIRRLLGIKHGISRVEGYDISNLSGTEATGSLVVFINGQPAKSEYRKFRIKTVGGANDTAMLREVVRRRLAHPEWPYPELMLIDGGRAQLGAAQAAKLQNTNSKSQTNYKFQNLKIQNISIAALAKHHEELYTEWRKAPLRLSTLPQNVALFFQRVRDESHRFAKMYHHKLREISYRQVKSA